ncbi:class I SAM-dependent methyltransferase [Haliovirga abyssi]|uniref:Methyltransferase type 11 n=1 Tax=Haliovirga abyssi TaxID=2996794 RepID=A0AAU9DC58_9FUSO|nr:class I SAM-dependent methyltransferase [Haliovirga abyssi]BDU49718.1 methyltransferase type 11 [Haliovirga abyssi]
MSKFIADIYDTSLYIPLKGIRKKIIDIIDELGVEEIIDICCGTGNQLKLLRKAGFTYSVGIDLSDDMLAVANNEKNNLNCKKEDATNLSFKDNKFEVGIISFALHEKPLEIQEAVLKEAKRVIKKDMYLIIVDYMFDDKVNFLGRFGIDIMERIAGEEHYKNFKNYIKNGGLENLTKDKFEKIKEYYFHFNGTRCVVYRNVKR